MEQAIYSAEILIQLGLHKQIANRILEPWAHINVVVTATSYENFYALRRHSDAQPEIKQLADCMWLAQNQSTPNLLQPGEWHLPYVTYSVAEQYAKARDLDPVSLAIHTSVARCARVSYLTHDGRTTSYEEDLALYERLVGGMPLHASPAEHQATPDTTSEYARLLYEGDKERVIDDPSGDWDNPDQHGNFTGWRQYRKMLPGEFTPG